MSNMSKIKWQLPHGDICPDLYSVFIIHRHSVDLYIQGLKFFQYQFFANMSPFRVSADSPFWTPGDVCLGFKSRYIQTFHQLRSSSLVSGHQEIYFWCYICSISLLFASRQMIFKYKDRKDALVKLKLKTLLTDSLSID